MCLLHFCSWPAACGDPTVVHHLLFILGVLKIAHKFPFHRSPAYPIGLYFLHYYGVLHLPKQHDWRKTSPVQQSPTEFMTAWFKQALPLAWQCGSKLGFPCVPTPILPTSPRWRMEVSKGDAAVAPKSTSLSHLHSLHPLFVCHWEASPYYQKQSCRCLFSTLSCFLRARLLRIHPPLLQQ